MILFNTLNKALLVDVVNIVIFRNDPDLNWRAEERSSGDLPSPSGPLAAHSFLSHVKSTQESILVGFSWHCISHF